MVVETPVLHCPHTSAAVPPDRSTAAVFRAPIIRRNFWNRALRHLKSISLFFRMAAFLLRLLEMVAPKDLALLTAFK